MSERTLLSFISGVVFGGAHNQAMRLAEPLTRRGWRTVVALPSDAGEAGNRIAETGVEVLYVERDRPRITRSPVPHARFVMGLPSQMASLHRILAEVRPSVVQVHGPADPAPAIAARRSKVGVCGNCSTPGAHDGPVGGYAADRDAR